MGKVAVITGAGRGIGAATARRLARLGWDIGFSYVADAAAAQTLRAELAALGVRTHAVRADAACPAQQTALFAELEERLGAPDALVNNAGILGGPLPVDIEDHAALARLIAVNVTGAFVAQAEAVRRMKAGGRGGAVVNVGSRLASIGGAGGFVPYAASKGAIDVMTLGSARELAPHGIRVNAVSPGVIDTDIHRQSGMPDRMATLTTQIPMGRPGQAEEVAAAIAWLLSPEASYVTGIVLPVAGGR